MTSKATISGVVIGFTAGAATAAAVALLFWPKKSKKKGPNKTTHPRQWAVWTRLCQRDNKIRATYVSREDIRKLCYRFESDEHADMLCKILDPDGDDRITFKEFVENFDAVAVMRKAARLKLWHRCCGIGVAGNVAGHMEMAGEASADSGGGNAKNTPTAIFSYYYPYHPFTHCDVAASKKQLEHFPVTYAVIDFPKLPGSSKVQVEPEVGLLCDIVYSKDRSKVDSLIPRRIAAFNDCSIRSLEGATLLHQKKNWGFGSKGISIRSFEIDTFAKGSFVDKLALVSYMKRQGVTYQYSVKAPARNYMMYNDALLEWIVERMNTQQTKDKFEEIFPSLVESWYPTSVWIALGAGEYTEWGRTNYAQPLDETVIIVYDESVYPEGPSAETVEDMFEDDPVPDGMVALHQTFV